MKENKSQFIIYLLLVIIPLAVYWQCTSFHFVWDDKYPNLIENIYLQNPTLENITHFWEKPYAQMYIPMSYTAWAVIAEIGKMLPFGIRENGFNPFAFHLFNILIHILNGILIFRILKLLFTSDLPSLIGTLFFLLHPLQVETVAWITEFRGLLAAFFGLSSLYILMKNEVLRRMNISQTCIRIRYINSLILFVFGMLSKPSVAVIPIFAFLIYFIYFKQSFWQSFKKVIPFIVIILPFIVILRHIQPSSYHAKIAPLWSRFFIWMDTINFYLFKSGLPYPLVTTYTRTFQNLLPQFWFYIEWIIPPALIVLALKTYKKDAYILLGLLIFIAGFLPVSGLIPFVFQKWSNVADRYVYFSMLGLGLIVAWLLDTYRKKIIWVLTTCILLCFTLLTFFIQIPVWKNSLTLWNHALAFGRPNTFAYNNRGAAYNECGEYEMAINDFNRALELDPEDASSYNNRGYALYKTDKSDKALQDFNKALEHDPSFYDVYINRGNTFKDKGDITSALENYKMSLKLEPSQAKSYYNIGLAYSENNKPDSALIYYQRAISQSPNYAAAYLNRGIAYSGMKQYEKALTDYNFVLQINPNDDYAYNNRGILYFDLGELDKALYDLSKSIELNPGRASVYYIRGKIYFVMKNYESALKDYSTAISLDGTLVNAYIKRALLYLEIGDLEEAYKDITSAESLQKNNIEILTAKGDILSRNRMFAESVPVYSKAIKISPSSGELYQKRAVSYYFLGKYDLAINDVQKAQSLDIEIPPSFMRALLDHR